MQSPEVKSTGWPVSPQVSGTLREWLPDGLMKTSPALVTPERSSVMRAVAWMVAGPVEVSTEAGDVTSDTNVGAVVSCTPVRSVVSMVTVRTGDGLEVFPAGSVKVLVMAWVPADIPAVIW